MLDFKPIPINVQTIRTHLYFKLNFKIKLKNVKINFKKLKKIRATLRKRLSPRIVTIPSHSHSQSLFLPL